MPRLLLTSAIRQLLHLTRKNAANLVALPCRRLQRARSSNCVAVERCLRGLATACRVMSRHGEDATAATCTVHTLQPGTVMKIGETCWKL